MTNPLSTQEAVRRCLEITDTKNYITYENEEVEGYEGNIIKGTLNASLIAELEGRTLCKSNNIKNIDLLIKNRLPVVIASFTNSQEILEKRDQGFILVMPESNQEIVDSIIQGFRIAERSKVSLPIVVNIDNIIVEEAEIPSKQSIDKFLTNFNIPMKLSTKSPAIFGTRKINPKQIQTSMNYAKDFIENVRDEWDKKFRRGTGLIETYNLENSREILVVTGSNAMTVKQVAKEMNKDQETNVGMIRIKTIRPWPNEKIKNILTGKKVGVLDQITSMGNKGILHNDIKSSVKSFCSSFIIGDKLLTKEETRDIFEELIKQKEEKTVWIW